MLRSSRRTAKNRLGFSGKIKRIRCLVEVNPLQAKTIVEQRRRAARAIGYQSLKTAIQILEKARVIFIKMD